MTITAQMVKELRDRTGAGMMDSKKALTENDGNFDAAIDWLRTKGIAKAEKKAGRIANQGLVMAKSEGTKGAIIEVNSETDFVAKNDKFKAFVNTLCDVVLKTGTVDVATLKTMDWPEGGTIGEALTSLVATIGENISIRRAAYSEVTPGIVKAYNHMGGKIGVLVSVSSPEENEKLEEVAKNVAMHVAASAPQYLNRDAVDADALAREKEVYTAQALESGKPENIIEKIVTGRINKFFEEICLLDQAFVMDTDRKVHQVLSDLHSEATITEYTRFGLGEGIEKKEEDFAAEVAAVAG